MFIVLSTTTGRLSCLISQILFLVFLNGSKYRTHASPPVTGLVDSGNILSNCLTVCTPNHFCSSINRWVTHLAVIFRNLKIRFRMTCTLISDMPRALAILRSMYLPTLSMISLTFEALFLPVAVTGYPDFAASLKALRKCEFSFSISVLPHRICYGTHKLPQIQ